MAGSMGTRQVPKVILPLDFAKTLAWSNLGDGPAKTSFSQQEFPHVACLNNLLDDTQITFKQSDSFAMILWNGQVLILPSSLLCE